VISLQQRPRRGPGGVDEVVTTNNAQRLASRCAVQRRSYWRVVAPDLEAVHLASEVVGESAWEFVLVPRELFGVLKIVVLGKTPRCVIDWIGS
jgi:hypothetical protein